MQPSQAPESWGSESASSFDLQTAGAIQEAEQYKNARIVMLSIAGVAAIVAFVAELRSWLTLYDCLLCFFVFGFWGIAALFMKDKLAILGRTVFLFIAIPMLLLPILRGEIKRLLLIGVSICVYFSFRRLADWANNQRPRDWNVILAEKKRLGWGPEEFFGALTHGRASDGRPLIMVVKGILIFDPREKRLFRDWNHVSEEAKSVQTDNDILTQREEYEHFKVLKIYPQYHAYTSQFRLALQQKRYPLLNLDLKKAQVALGISDEDFKEMMNADLYVHPEILDRMEDYVKR
jgi:hypothetical protein